MTTELKVYAIYDTRAEYYLTPFFMANDATAVRAFQGQSKTPGLMQDYPEDFSLHCIGTYDTNLGEVLHEPHRMIAKGEKRA